MSRFRLPNNSTTYFFVTILTFQSFHCMYYSRFVNIERNWNQFSKPPLLHCYVLPVSFEEKRGAMAGHPIQQRKLWHYVLVLFHYYFCSLTSGVDVVYELKTHTWCKRAGSNRTIHQSVHFGQKRASNEIIWTFIALFNLGCCYSIFLERENTKMLKLHFESWN